MSQPALVVVSGRVVGVYSWTEGFRPLQCPRKALTEEDVLAIALRLEKRGMQEEALAFIECFFEYHLQ
jgi:hypothetical protein